MSLQKRFWGVMLVGGIASTTAIANEYNSGQIKVEGVVAQQWEITVQDLSDGFDFDFSASTIDSTDTSFANNTSSRVGTVYIYTNGDDANVVGHLTIESANLGRMVNTDANVGNLAGHQPYVITMAANGLDGDAITFSGALPTNYSLHTPYQVNLFHAAAAEGALYDVTVTLDGQVVDVPGWYEDTMTFTILDDM